MSDLTSWFKDRPKWMQEAASLLFEKGSLTDKDITTLLDQCLQGAGIGDMTTILFDKFSQDIDAGNMVSKDATALLSKSSQDVEAGNIVSKDATALLDQFPQDVDAGNMAPKDITTLLDAFLQEANAGDTAIAESSSADTIQDQKVQELRLCTISNIKNINSLAPKNPLDFEGSNLVVVYGENGSGKSGYVRILKHVCGARNPGALHRNVFRNHGTAQSADIEYSVGTEKLPVVSWSPGGNVRTELRLVDIFDADCGRVYLEKKNEVTYEPPILQRFSDLASVCEQLTQRIDDQLKEHGLETPDMPLEHDDTEAKKWYEALTATTPPKKIATHTKWDAKDKASVAELEKWLAEKAPADKAKDLLKRKNHVDSLVKTIEDLLLKISDEKCHCILKLKKDKITTKIAQDTASMAFSDTPLKGVGTNAWKLLWERARQYSEEYAYPDQEFPHLTPDALCVLCHQPLLEHAQKRFTSFEEFVKGQATKDAESAEQAFDCAMTSIKILTDQDIKVQCDAGGLGYTGDMPLIVQSVEVLRQRKNKLLEVESIDALPQTPDCTAWLQKAKEQASKYAEEAEKYQKDLTPNTKPQLEIQLRELKARKWVWEQRDAVSKKIKRLKLVAHLEKAKRSTDTTKLSRKKSQLADTLITEAFVQRFNTELEAVASFRLRVKVKLVKKGVVHGKVLHELKLPEALPGTKFGIPHEVLSEGEHKIVSLAAFLADVTGKQQLAPFVFDDPISSLDQKFEEAVVERLVRLSKNRQVIVFTHRLSLLGLIQDTYDKTKVICIRSEDWGTGEPGDTPLFVKKPHRALNALRNEKLSQARKKLAQGGHEAYEPLANNICREFRILLERMIEVELLADVISRHRQDINTRGKLNKLAHIKPKDCEFFDDMMTKYSRYLHPPSRETPIPLPLPDELEADLKELQDWHAGFLGKTETTQ